MSNFYSGRARGTIISLDSVAIANITVADTGELPASGGSIPLTIASVNNTQNISGLSTGLTTGVIELSTSGGVAPSTNISANSSSTVNNLALGIQTALVPPTGVITVNSGLIQSTSAAFCGGATAATTTISDLTLTALGLPVALTIPTEIPANYNALTVPVVGLSVILNEQIVTPGDITVNAVHITLAVPLIGTLDIIIGQSHSDIACIPIICVLPGATVDTPRGLVKIEDIRKGDQVLNENDEFVEIINNVKCFAGIKGYTLLKKNCFGVNLPSDDISITDGHPIKPPGSNVETSPHLLANKDTIIHKRGDIPPTYTLITAKRTFVKTNNILVATWADKKFDYDKYDRFEYL